MHKEETPQAKLRNQLTPLYSLAQMIFHLEGRPDIKEELLTLIMDTAKQAIENKHIIDELLIEIDGISSQENKQNLPTDAITKKIEKIQLERKQLLEDYLVSNDQSTLATLIVEKQFRINDLTEILGNGINWTEDFSHENGNYLNTCTICGKVFKGHKRRVVCKSCFNNPTESQK